MGRLGATASDSEVVASLDAFPNCDFFDVRAIVRPWRQEAVVSALLDVGVRGLTQAAVKGIGRQGGAAKERFMGKEYGSNDLVDKIQLSIVVPRDQVQVVCNTVIESARTGEIGDGKVRYRRASDLSDRLHSLLSIHRARLTLPLSPRLRVLLQSSSPQIFIYPTADVIRIRTKERGAP